MNTFSDFTWTHAKENTFLQEYFESMVFAKAISKFKTGIKVLENPYMADIATTVSTSITNTYTVEDITTIDEDLTVSKESKMGVHITNYEKQFADYNLGSEFLMRVARKHAIDVDKDLALELSTNAGNTVAVPGGFTAANIITEVAKADSFLTGYAQSVNGSYLWIDASQMPALTEAGALSNYKVGDSTLLNGYTNKDFMGHEVYVSRGTLPADTALIGIKGASSTGIGKDIHVERKGVTSKFGTEYASVVYFTSKLWERGKNLVVKYNFS